MADLGAVEARAPLASSVGHTVATDRQRLADLTGADERPDGPTELLKRPERSRVGLGGDGY